MPVYGLLDPALKPAKAAWVSRSLAMEKGTFLMLSWPGNCFWWGRGQVEGLLKEVVVSICKVTCLIYCRGREPLPMGLMLGTLFLCFSVSFSLALFAFVGPSNI